MLLPKWPTSRFWDVSVRYGCTWTSLMGPVHARRAWHRGSENVAASEIERVIAEVPSVAALPRSTISKVNKAALRTFLTSGDLLEQAERNWLAEAAADPSGDAP